MYTVGEKNANHFIFLDSSVKNQPDLVIFDTLVPENLSSKDQSVNQSINQNTFI